MTEGNKKEVEYYIANQRGLIDQYENRVVVIKGEKVIGDYSSEFDAVMDLQGSSDFDDCFIKLVPSEMEPAHEIERPSRYYPPFI
ncbi:hypothetical protein ACFLQJ_00510 [Calditrichota bacterium]